MKLYLSILIVIGTIFCTGQINLAQPIPLPENYDDQTSTTEPSNTEIEATTTEPESSTETESSPQSETAKKPPTAEEIARYQTLAIADQLYLLGDKTAATKLYQEVKQPWEIETQLNQRKNQPQPFFDPQKLSPAGAVYWRNYQSGLAQQLESKIFVSLQFLVEQQPEFIPGHIHYAQAFQAQGQSEEALKILENAVSKYPNQTQLLKAKMEADIAAKKWLDASITARQFALFNPQHPQAAEFTQLADDYLVSFQNHLRSEIRENAIGNFITGALGYALTGNLFGPISALETSIMLLRGETAVGDRFAKKVQEYVPMVEDPEVLNYVKTLGKKIATVAGRDEFDYQFYVVMDDQLNAFALPGGKVFVNAGAIMETESEAELAGLLAHEISHAVLSHSFQLIAKGNLTANVTQYIPYVGGLAGNLIVLDYSRDMERQADVFGTRILTAAGYAADGVRNLMVKLDEYAEKEELPEPPAWLSTHPDSQERISYIEKLIVQNNLNRYAYEGVTKHQRMRDKVTKLWQEYQQTEEYKERKENGEY